MTAKSARWRNVFFRVIENRDMYFRGITFRIDDVEVPCLIYQVNYNLES